MTIVNMMWWILGAQVIFFGLSYMADVEYAKKNPTKKFFRKWWRTSIAVVLLTVDLWLLGFARGIGA